MMTAYPIMMIIKMTMMGLVMLPIPPNTPEEAAAPISTPCRELMISVERASKLSPYPVIPEVRLACSVTESL